MILSDKDDSV